MIHTIRWTAQKIAQRLKLIAPLVYRRRESLSPFHYQALAGPLDAPPVGQNVDDSAWPIILPNTYWGKWRTDFVLRGQFQRPVQPLEPGGDDDRDVGQVERSVGDDRRAERQVDVDESEEGEHRHSQDDVRDHHVDAGRIRWERVQRRVLRRRRRWGWRRFVVTPIAGASG